MKERNGAKNAHTRNKKPSRWRDTVQREVLHKSTINMTQIFVAQNCLQSFLELNVSDSDMCHSFENIHSRIQ